MKLMVIVTDHATERIIQRANTQNFYSFALNGIKLSKVIEDTDATRSLYYTNNKYGFSHRMILGMADYSGIFVTDLIKLEKIFKLVIVTFFPPKEVDKFYINRSNNLFVSLVKDMGNSKKIVFVEPRLKEKHGKH